MNTDFVLAIVFGAAAAFFGYKATIKLSSDSTKETAAKTTEEVQKFSESKFQEMKQLITEVKGTKDETKREELISKLDKESAEWAAQLKKDLPLLVQTETATKANIKKENIEKSMNLSPILNEAQNRVDAAVRASSVLFDGKLRLEATALPTDLFEKEFPLIGLDFVDDQIYSFSLTGGSGQLTLLVYSTRNATTYQELKSGKETYERLLYYRNPEIYAHFTTDGKLIDADNALSPTFITRVKGSDIPQKDTDLPTTVERLAKMIIQRKLISRTQAGTKN